MSFRRPLWLIGSGLLAAALLVAASPSPAQENSAQEPPAPREERPSKPGRSDQDAGEDAGEAARDVSLEGLKLQIPAGWKKQDPSNRLRLAQFEVPGPSDDHEPAELSVFHFANSSPASNIARWKSAFQPAERRAQVKQGTFEQGEYVLVDITGTYNKPTGQANAGGFATKSRPAADYRMLAVMLRVPKKGAYFLKLVGERDTVNAAADAFRAAFGGDASQEKDYTADP